MVLIRASNYPIYSITRVRVFLGISSPGTRVLTGSKFVLYFRGFGGKNFRKLTSKCKILYNVTTISSNSLIIHANIWKSFKIHFWMYKFHSKLTSILPKIRDFTVVKLPGYYLLQYPGTGIKIVPGYPGIVPGYGRSTYDHARDF